MHKRRLIIVFLFSLVCLSTEAQDAAKKKWDIASSLQWSDFEGQIDQSSKFQANTHSGISYNWRSYVDSTIKITFTTESFMDKSQSWTIPDKQTPQLLKHEQVHFDISEFFSRKLLQEFNSYKYTIAYKTEIDEIYQKIMQARKAMEDEYDNQTNHSINKIKQVIWENYIFTLLNENYSYNEALEKEPKSEK